MTPFYSDPLCQLYQGARRDSARYSRRWRESEDDMSEPTSCPKCGTPRMSEQKDKDGRYLRCHACGTFIDLGKDGQPLVPIVARPPTWPLLDTGGDRGMRSVAGVKVMDGIHLRVKRAKKKEVDIDGFGNEEAAV